ncbi:MAG: Xaa-Pro peptidase family protein [Pirellulales bacterium]
MSRFETRRSKLIKRLARAGADGLLVTDFTNVTYLTGFTGDDSYLLVSPDSTVLVSDSRYEIQLAEECAGLDVLIRGRKTKMIDAVADVVKQAGLDRLGVEATSITLDLWDRLGEKLAGQTLVRTSNLVEGLRVVKDRYEIDCIRQAAWQARRAFEVVRSSLTPDLTERQVAARLENELRRFGAIGFSFPPIIAVGPRAALPHASPTDKKIGESDFTLFDWGANNLGYVSDLTRMVVTGRISPKLRRVYGVVLNAQTAAIEAVAPGVACADVDRVARKIVVKAGYGKHFGHGLGHGIGLQVHEAPGLSSSESTKLKPGMVVTVEPGIYLPGWGGVRIEDDVLVTRSGREVLSSVSKDLDQCVVG